MDKHYFTNDYLPKMHRIGKITGVLGVFASFLPALVLGFGHGLWPDLALLATCFITVTTSFGFLWVIEPISYYPVLGPVGTYMAFLSGNISNMRVPCASIAQVSADVELGSEQGSIISTIGMGVSIIINIIILSVGVIAGSSTVRREPEKAGRDHAGIRVCRLYCHQQRSIQLPSGSQQLSGNPVMRIWFHIYRHGHEKNGRQKNGIDPVSLPPSFCSRCKKQQNAQYVLYFLSILWYTRLNTTIFCMKEPVGNQLPSG